MTTNLRPAPSGLAWSFDLGGIAALYHSYEPAQLWDLLRAPPQGLKVDVAKVARSAFGWDGEAWIGALGHGVHVLDAGHWMHTENPGAHAVRCGAQGGEGATGWRAACYGPPRYGCACCAERWEPARGPRCAPATSPPAPAVVHTLTEVGHDSHMDLCVVLPYNPCPGGLFNILAPSLGAVDLHLVQSSKWYVQFTARR